MITWVTTKNTTWWLFQITFHHTCTYPLVSFDSYDYLWL